MTEETKICPFCGEEILAVAKKCKHCKQFLPQEVESTVNGNNSLQSNVIDKLQDKKIIIGIVLAIAITGLMFNSSKTILSGCNYENSNTFSYGRTDFFLCKNKPYTSMEIRTREGDSHLNHSVYKRSDMNYLIAERKRINGDYECYSPITEEKIQSCSIAQLEKLAINAGNNLETYKQIWDAKTHIKKTFDDIYNLRREYQKNKKDEDYNKLPKDKNGFEPSIRWTEFPDPPLPSQLNELMNAFKDYEKNEYQDVDYDKVPRYVFTGYQAKAPNGNILAFSEDLQYLTVYDSDNPKCYSSVKMNFTTADYEDTDKVIPADHYIKNSNNLIKLNEKEMEQ